MEQPSSIGWGPIAAVALIIVLLNVTGMLWLGVSQERMRTDIARLARQVREKPAVPAAVEDAADLKAIQDGLAALTAKVDGLAAAADPKAVARLASEMKTLSGRVDALAKTKAAPAKAASPAKTTGRPRPIIEDDQPPRPFYGPGYPAWPGSGYGY